VKAPKKNLQSPPETPPEETPPPEVPETSQPSPQDEPQQPLFETEAAAEQTPTTEPKETIADLTGKRKQGRPTKEDSLKSEQIIDRLYNMLSWDGVYVYVYRQRPVTNKLLSGEKNVFVKRWDTRFDEQELLEEAGSGLYLLRATRRDPKTGQRPQFDMGEQRVLNMNYPPKIPPGEWVSDPRNKEWEWAKDIIFQKTPATAAAPAADPLVEILRDQINAGRQEMAIMRQEMRESATKKDSGEQTLMSVLAPFVPAIVAKLTAPPPPPPPAADPFAMMTAALTFMDKVRPPITEQPKDAAAELDRVLDLQDKMEARMGGGKHGGRSRKTGLQELIADVAPSVAQVLSPVMQMILTGMNRAQQQAGIQPLQLQPPPSQPGQPELTEVQPHPGPGVGPRPVEHRKQPTVEGFSDKVLELLKEGADGYQLGDWYVDEFGIDEMNDVREQGKPQILKDLRSCPNPWRFIAVYEESGALDKFLREFVTWEPPTEDDPEEEPRDEEPGELNDMQSGWMQTQETV